MRLVPREPSSRYNDTALAIADGSAICFNWEPVPQPSHIITFQVVLDGVLDSTLTNVAMHDNSALGTVPEGASATILTPTGGFPVAVDDEYSVLCQWRAWKCLRLACW